MRVTHNKTGTHRQTRPLSLSLSMPGCIRHVHVPLHAYIFVRAYVRAYEAKVRKGCRRVKGGADAQRAHGVCSGTKSTLHL